MTQAMRSMRMVADRREVAQGAPRVTPWLASSARSTGRHSVRCFSTDTPGSPELSEATQDLLPEEAVDLTERIDRLDVVLAFDEVEWVRGISADEHGPVPAAPPSVSTSPLAMGVVVGLTSSRSVTDLIFILSVQPLRSINASSSPYTVNSSRNRAP